MTVTETRRDILDAGELTIGPDGTAVGPWVSTEGVIRLAACAQFPYGPGNPSAWLQESNDESAALNGAVLTATLGIGFAGTALPACAFVRMAVQGGAGLVVTYSLRDVS